MTYSKDSLKKWSGGGTSIRTKYNVPTIKFNGNSGKLMKFPVGDFKNGTDIADVELVIMRARRVFTSYEKLPDKSTVRMFTNEHNTWNDHMTVFEVRTGKNIKAVGSGKLEQIRSEFPTLRINSNLYCLYDGEVYKLSIKGKSRQSFVDKQKELAKDGIEFFEKKVKLVPVQETGPGGNIYYFLNYEVVGDSKLDEVGPHMEDMGKIMDLIDEEYAATNKRMEGEAKALTGGETSVEEDIIPIEETTNIDDEEIDPENIPF